MVDGTAAADPRRAKTLGEACSNGDGTYNGVKLISWLSEVLNPGKGVPEESVQREFERVKAVRLREIGRDNRAVGVK